MVGVFYIVRSGIDFLMNLYCSSKKAMAAAKSNIIVSARDYSYQMPLGLRKSL